MRLGQTSPETRPQSQRRTRAPGPALVDGPVTLGNAHEPPDACERVESNRAELLRYVRVPNPRPNMRETVTARMAT